MNFSIVGMGEVLWDMLPSGRQMGGAPANFACHAASLGARAGLISRVGDDDLGREILTRLTSMRVSTDTVGVDRELRTGAVSVEVSSDGQPRFTIEPNSAWDAITANAASLRAGSTCDAVCFGSLAQRDEKSRQSIWEILEQVRGESLRILDINLRAPFFDEHIVRESLTRANVLKLNHEELPIVAKMTGVKSAGLRDQIAELMDRYRLNLIAVTHGGDGSVLRSAGGEVCEHPSVKVNVVDAVGAGDAFTAAMTLGYLQGWTLDRIGRRANELAAYVCTQPGATPVLPESVLSRWRAES